MKIYVIRHGETDANKESVFQGSSDWPLNEDGKKLATITGQKMKGIKFDACYSSPLIRAKQTAEILLKESGNDVDIEYDNRLKEINAGVYEGKKIWVTKPNKPEIPRILMLLFKYNPFLCGKFKGGESVRQVCRRTQDFLKELSKKDYENVLVSMHGCSMRAMLNMLYDNKFDFWQGNVPYNCSVNIIEVKDNKMKIIEKDKVYYDKGYIVDRYSFGKTND